MHKNTKIVAALMAIGLVSPMAYATNGDQMMAIGSQNSALGGTGVANFTGAESTFANPAMLGKSKGSEVVGGVVYFRPTVTNTGINGAAPQGVAATSSADPSVIPDVSYSSRISDSLTYGIAMAGIAGMGVDYTGANNTFTTGTETVYLKAKTTMSILRVVPTIAYNDKDFGVGFSPVLQYGSLAISYDATPFGGQPTNAAHKADSDTGYGYSLGGYFNVMPALTVAAAYQSAIAMTYGKQLSTAGLGFGEVFADKLDQPAEMKAGVAYTMSNVTLTADFKQIQWGSAAGYKQFGWKDQTVVALGAKYAGNGFWVGAGYNKANDPIGVYPAAATTPAGNNGGTVNMFNNMMFPAIVKDSYTFGGGYSMSKALDLEASAVISPKVTKKVDIDGAFNTTTHSQQAVSLSLRYKF